MKSKYMKLKLKFERTLIAKIMKLRKELKETKKVLEGTQQENHKLIDVITLKNMEIRNLELGIRNERKYK